MIQRPVQGTAISCVKPTRQFTASLERQTSLKRPTLSPPLNQSSLLWTNIANNDRASNAAAAVSMRQLTPSAVDHTSLYWVIPYAVPAAPPTTYRRPFTIRAPMVALYLERDSC